MITTQYHYHCRSRPNETPRGPGFWKFNNSLLEDKEYTTRILELYPQLREKYHYVNDQQLFAN